MNAAPFEFPHIILHGLKREPWGVILAALSLSSKAKTASLNEAAVATVTVLWSPVGLEILFSCLSLLVGS